MAKDSLLLIRGFVTTDRFKTCDEINIRVENKYNLQTRKQYTGLS
jgi:hypothetical protein